MANIAITDFPITLKHLIRTRYCSSFSRTDHSCLSVAGRGRFDEETMFAAARKRAAKPCLGILAGLVGGCGTILCLLEQSVKAGAPHPFSLPDYPWRFNQTFKSFDHAALRRGWQVYRTACSTCHSLRYVRFIDFIDKTHTEVETRAIAEQFEVEDGPDEEGNYYWRAAKLSDTIPPPFPNEKAARAANFGAYPADLTYMVYTKSNGFNFLFSFLTGWTEPPAGVKLQQGQYFNPYFHGGVIGMAPVLQDGIVEYEDGTPATQSQMAKDLVEFLAWTAAPEHDTRQIMLLKGIGVFTVLTLALLDLYKRNMSHIRSRRIAHVPKPGR